MKDVMVAYISLSLSVLYVCVDVYNILTPPTVDQSIYMGEWMSTREVRMEEEQGEFRSDEV